MKKNEFEIGVSVGCSTVEKGGSLEEGFRLADENMYSDKQSRKKISLTD